MDSNVRKTTVYNNYFAELPHFTRSVCFAGVKLFFKQTQDRQKESERQVLKL